MERFLSYSVLMPYYPVFIVKPIIGTGIIRAVEKTIHLVLVKIHHAGVTIVILVIHVIRAGLAVCCFFLFHCHFPPVLTDLHYIRTCSHRVNVRIIRHNFVGDKAKIRRRAVALKGFLTQSPAKFDEKTCMNPYVDRFLTQLKHSCVKLIIFSMLSNKLIMISSLNYLTMFKHHDSMRITYS